MTAGPADAGDDLASWLFREPYQFRFFQAVRLLQLLFPDRQPVGHDFHKDRPEVVTFRSRLSLAFPPSELYDLGWPARSLDYTSELERKPPRNQPPFPPAMTVAFMGLTGPLGVLPRHVTEQLIELDESRVKEKDAFRAWLDLFNHRLVSLFYRAWEKYRFYIAYERNRPRNADTDPFVRALLGLVGLGTQGLRDRLRVCAGRRPVAGAHASPEPLACVDDLRLLYYAGFFAQRRRCAASLQALLADYFGLDARVEPFRGQWLYLEPSQQSSLRDGGNNQLGLNAVAGNRVWDAQGKFRLCLGPLDYGRFLEFLPDRSPRPSRKSFFLLCQIVRLYVGPDLDFDIQLVLQAESVPLCQLTDSDPAFPRLGWNIWAGDRTPGRDADEAVFEADDAVWLESP